MIFCVIFNSAAPAEAGPTRRGATAQEEKRSPTRTTARNPNERSFTVTVPAVARGKRLKAARRESCRIIRHLGSGIDFGTSPRSRVCLRTLYSFVVTSGRLRIPAQHPRKLMLAFASRLCSVDRCESCRLTAADSGPIISHAISGCSWLTAFHVAMFDAYIIGDIRICLISFR